MFHLFSLFAVVFFVGMAQAEVVDRVVAVVNAEIITESEVRSFAKKLEENKMVDDLLLFGQSRDKLRSDKDAQLNYLVSEKILDTEIKRLNLSVTIERVEQEIRDIAKRNGASRADLMSAIKAQGMSASEYQDFLKTRIERQSLIEQEISSKIRVSEEDVGAQLKRLHPDAEISVSEYTLAHILFNPKKGGSDKALERAEAALRRIRAGESFEVVAEQTSEDSHFTNGGALGTFKSGEFNKDMESSVAQLNSGEVSKIVQTKAGYHVIKVVAKKSTNNPRFEKEREKIRNELFEAAFQKHLMNWISLKKDEAFIKRNI